MQLTVGHTCIIRCLYLTFIGNAIGPFCPGDPATTLVGNPAGGTWSGTGVGGNDFDPATAGVGNYVLTTQWQDVILQLM